MITLLSEETIITLLVLPESPLDLFNFPLLSIFLHDSLIKPLRLRNRVVGHGLVVLDHDPMLDLAHDAHLKLLLEVLLSLLVQALIEFPYVITLLLYVGVQIVEVLFPVEDFRLVL